MNQTTTGRILVEEQFRSERLPDSLRWMYPPANFRVEPERGILSVEPVAKSDFWQRTHNGAQADSGHFLHMPVSGDFAVTAEVASYPLNRYDQAGVLVRASAECWVKASLEYEPGGPSKLGAVVTNRGFSDWSFEEAPSGVGALRVQIRKTGQDIEVFFADAGSENWRRVRQAHLDGDVNEPVDCGLYACSPIDAGFRAELSLLRIETIGTSEE